MTIGDMEKLVGGRIGKMKPEEERRQTVMAKWMEEMFGDIDPEDM